MKEMKEEDVIYQSYRELKSLVFFLEGILGQTNRQKNSVNSLLKYFEEIEAEDFNFRLSVTAEELKNSATKWSEQTKALLDESGDFSVAKTLAKIKKLMGDAKSRLIALDDPRVRA
ncbi:hypothetical protein HY797_01735 [Candidatus Falkowbacteria bacterium]|nr:hypothetical protein [Candidatus Falkowbacteria bacterium]